jgi:hypothetical protein
VKGRKVKLSETLLFLLLLFIPTQLGRHFWFDWSLIWGIRIDYLSPTLYLVDLIWIGLFLVESLSSYKVFKVKDWFCFKNLLILGFVVVNILMAQSRWIAFYKWIRIGQLVWFGYYVAKNKELMWKLLKKVIPFWIIMESLLAVGQIAKGGSLNGWWWWLGERNFDFNTIGIAQMSVADLGLVRAYGTFSHPNSLAGFLLVAIVLWIKTKPLSLPPAPSLTRGGRKYLSNVCWWGVMWLGVIGLILTGSRTIWVLTLISLVWFLWGNFKKIKNKGKILLLIMGLLFLVYKIIDFNYPINSFLGGWDENGLLKRGQLNLAAVEMIQKSPWFGVGAGNFLVELPSFLKNNQIFWFQPVHNILLLLVAEVGLLGMFLGIWWFIKKILNSDIKKNDWLILGIIFISGMVDHYWFTLPQNMWLLTLVLGLV